MRRAGREKREHRSEKGREGVREGGGEGVREEMEGERRGERACFLFEMKPQVEWSVESAIL